MKNHFKWILMLWLAACIVISCAANPSSVDTKTWKTYRVDVGAQFVEFAIPLGESRDFPTFEIPRRIDVTQPGVFDQAQMGPKLLNRHWDYRSSRFASVEGTLHGYIVLWHSDRELRDTAALESASEENAQLVRIKEMMDGGSGGPPDARRYDSVTIAGKSALLVHHSITSENYIVPTDLHHYLSISVRNSVTHPGLRTEAQAAADAILQSIRIEPKP